MWGEATKTNDRGANNTLRNCFFPRLRHRRGHGIHSPLVYKLVREVFMLKEIKGADRRLYGALTTQGVSKKTAVQLQNLYTSQGYGSFRIRLAGHTAEAGEPQQGASLWIHSFDAPPEEDEDIKDGTICILASNRWKKRLCAALAEEHDGISIDRKTYWLYFYSPSYGKQHFKL